VPWTPRPPQHRRRPRRWPPTGPGQDRGSARPHPQHPRIGLHQSPSLVSCISGEVAIAMLLGASRS
jgi:hypothetical protein